MDKMVSISEARSVFETALTEAAMSSRDDQVSLQDLIARLTEVAEQPSEGVLLTTTTDNKGVN